MATMPISWKHEWVVAVAKGRQTKYFYGVKLADAMRAAGVKKGDGFAFSRFTPLGLDGQSFALFVVVLAAAEAAVALAIALNFYNNHTTIDVDRGNELHG